MVAGAAAPLETAGLDPWLASMTQLLSMSQHGLIWVDSNLHVLSCNPIAQRLLRGGDGIRLREQRLLFARPELTRELVTFISATDAGSLQELRCSNGLLMRRIERSHGKTPYFIAAMRIVSGTGLSGGMLLLEDLGASPRLQADVCRAVYGLTPAEARVAMRLIEGRSAPGIAQDLRLSTLTVRTHIKHVFKKVNVRSQAQLMAALCRIAWLPVGVNAVETHQTPAE